MRSVVVVLPASMCAMIPMFRVFSIETGRSAIFNATFISLVPEVAESLVALGHPVGFFLALHRATGVLGGVENLERQLLGHTLPAPLAGKPNDPAPRQGQPAIRPDLDRHLVRRAADPPRLHLEQRRRVADRQLEHLERLLLRLLARALQRVVHDPLRGRPLPAAHHYVDELRDGLGLVDGVGRDDTLDRSVSTRHQAAALPFSRLAPYFERAFLRFLVPAVSRVPRMMW